MAPTGLAEQANRTGQALFNFERDAKDVTVNRAQALREVTPFLDWGHAEAFVAAARRDLRVESRVLARWRHRY